MATCAHCLQERPRKKEKKRPAEKVAKEKPAKKAKAPPAEGAKDGKAKKPRAKKDPNAPKRGLSSYMLYSNDMRAQVINIALSRMPPDLYQYGSLTA